MADTIEFALDLDAKEFLEKGNEAIEKIADMIGQGEALKATLGEVAVVAGIVGAAVLALKASLSMSEAAEHIEQVNQQFDVMTKQAGIATGALIDGLHKAAGGLIDDTTLMQIANKAIVEMGQSAQRLPEILELSRKAAALTGESVEETFKGMTEAIGRGNVRMLKHYGILIDAKKAVEEYAKANDIAVGAISAAEQRQAIMNATLEQGKESLKGINPEITETANTLQQIKTIATELGEAISIAFEKIAGPAIHKFLAGVKEMAGDFKNYITRTFTDGKEAADLNVKALEDRLMQAKARVVDAQFGQRGWLDQVLHGSNEDVIAKAQAEIAQTETMLKAAKGNLSKLEAADEKKAGESPAVKQDMADYEKRKQLANQFNSELLKIREKNAQDAINNAQTDEQLLAARNERKLAQEKKYHADLATLEANQNMTRAQKGQMAVELAKQHKAQELRNEESFNAERIKMLDNYERHATGVADGIARGFAAGSKKAAIDLKNFGKQGEKMFDSFGNHATDALMEMGKGTKSASDIMKGFILGFIADAAESYGKFVLLASIYPPNPVGLVAGAGLLALAGFLRSQAGGSASAIPGGDAGGGGGASSTSAVPSTPQAQAAQQKQAVTLQIQGNYFETDQTRAALVNMIRSAADATDFRVLQIGQT